VLFEAVQSLTLLVVPSVLHLSQSDQNAERGSSPIFKFPFKLNRIFLFPEETVEARSDNATSINRRVIFSVASRIVL
jgi:hypothetical protein